MRTNRKNRSINKRDRRIYAVIMQEVKDALKTKNINLDSFIWIDVNEYSKKDKTYFFVGYDDTYELTIDLWKFKYVNINLEKISTITINQ
jgi:hypothetical protein